MADTKPDSTNAAIATAESIPLMLSINSYENYEGVIPGQTKKVLCLKHPPKWLAKVAKQITLERVKIGIILFFVLAAAVMFSFSHEEDGEVLHLSGITLVHPLVVPVVLENRRDILEALVAVQDTTLEEGYPHPTYVYVQVEGSNDNVTWTVAPPDSTWQIETEDVELEEEIHDFFLDTGPDYKMYRWFISTNSPLPVGITFRFRELFSIVRYEVVIASCILIGVYIVIMFELMHRAIAALLGSFVCLGFLSVIHGRPSFETVLLWIDFETVTLLFGMMVMVGIFSETGFFEWAAIRAYKLSKGKVWLLTIILCTFTGAISALLDNVTTILLVSPVTIRLCRVLDIQPQPMLLALVMMSNIGGTSTVIGDPPNIIIYNDPNIKSHEDITFATFTLHMLPGVLLAGVSTLILTFLLNKKSLARKPHEGKKRELQIWYNTLKKIKDDDEDERRVREQLQEYINHLEREIKENPSGKMVDITELESQYIIKNVPLFISSTIVLSCVIIMFFLHTVIEDVVELNLAWIAIIGAMIHLLVSGIHEIEEVLEKVELGTLLFFAGLFVLMHGLDLLGLIDFIGEIIYDIIEQVPAGDARLACAILIIVWVSGIASAFIDNIPYTTAMVPVIVSLSESDLGLPLTPLVWALAYGTCFGGNGTLIGASANVVGVGMLEQQGYPVTFISFFKFGFPVMLASVACASVYLIISHVLIPWY